MSLLNALFLVLLFYLRESLFYIMLLFGSADLEWPLTGPVAAMLLLKLKCKLITWLHTKLFPAFGILLWFPFILIGDIFTIPMPLIFSRLRYGEKLTKLSGVKITRENLFATLIIDLLTSCTLIYLCWRR